MRPDATTRTERASAGTFVRLAGHALKVFAPKVKGNQSGWIPYSSHRHMQQCSTRGYVQKTTQNGALPAKIKNPPARRLQRSPAFQSAPANRNGAIRSPKTHRLARLHLGWHCRRSQPYQDPSRSSENLLTNTANAHRTRMSSVEKHNDKSTTVVNVGASLSGGHLTSNGVFALQQAHGGPGGHTSASACAITYLCRQFRQQGYIA